VGDVIHNLQWIAYVLLSLCKAKTLRAVKVFGKQTQCGRGPGTPCALTGWPESPGGMCSRARLASAYSVSCLPVPVRSQFLLISLTLSIVSSGMANPCLACLQAHLDCNTDLYFPELVPQHLMHWLSQHPLISCQHTFVGRTSTHRSSGRTQCQFRPGNVAGATSGPLIFCPFVAGTLCATRDLCARLCSRRMSMNPRFGFSAWLWL
jgi:hypothetical protein